MTKKVAFALAALSVSTSVPMSALGPSSKVSAMIPGRVHWLMMVPAGGVSVGWRLGRVEAMATAERRSVEARNFIAG